MEIIYESGPDPKPLVFGDVPVNQFFVSTSGHLCQKSGTHSANIIASADGTPYGWPDISFASVTPIKRILPAVKQIKF